MLYPCLSVSIPCAPQPNTFPTANAALSPSLLSSAATIALREPTAPLKGAVAAVRALRIDPLAALRHE